MFYFKTMRTAFVVSMLVLAACGDNTSLNTTDAGGLADSVVAHDSTPVPDSQPQDVVVASELPMGSGVTVLAAKTPCPAIGGRTFDCSIMDLRVDVRPDQPGDQGLELRLYVPNSFAVGSQAPANFLLPGTGHCATRLPIASLEADPDNPAVQRILTAAEEGIVMVEFALRGHRSCYEASDALFESSTWIGPEEVRDAEEVLSRLMGGNLDPAVPKVDSTRLGLSGASHGGISTLVYARRMRVPHPFAAIIPAVGTPDLIDTWVLSSLDPLETVSTATSLGMIAVSGFSAQQLSYPGGVLDDLLLQWEAGDFSQVEPFFAYRAAYDDDGSLDTLTSKVKAMFLRTGGRDCTVPNRSQFKFWDKIRAYPNRGEDRWIISLWPHSCKGVAGLFPTPEEMLTVGGYFPTWSAAARAASVDLLAALSVQFWRKHLLGRTDVDLPGPVLVTPLVREGSSCTGPFGCAGDYRAVSAISTEVDTQRDFYLTPSKTLSAQAVPAYEMPVVDHQPQGVCTVLDSVEPCGQIWNAGNVVQRATNLEQIRSTTAFTTTLSQSMTWVGSAELELTVRISNAPAGGGIVALLWYTPPGAPASTNGWLVSQAWQYLNKTDAAGLVPFKMDIDSRVMELKQGGTLRLELTNMSSYVHHKPWVHPHPAPYQLSLVVDASHPARLRFPVSTTLLSKPVLDLSSFAL